MFAPQLSTTNSHHILPITTLGSFYYSYFGYYQGYTKQSIALPAGKCS
ncbi:MAG: hypothetical protein JXB07_05200 [Anaerolineae bacterium]|nr:hypothetical protein [Anaerolineae bacterium]